MPGVRLTTDNFEQEVMGSNLPVIVDFWAEWCSPCKMIHPILEEIEHEYRGQLKVGAVDVDSHQELASQFNIISIPTLLLFKDGTVVTQQVGAGPKQAIEKLFKDYL
jgi:thioredoxin 1